MPGKYRNDRHDADLTIKGNGTASLTEGFKTRTYTWKTGDKDGDTLRIDFQEINGDDQWHPVAETTLSGKPKISFRDDADDYYEPVK